MMQFNKPTNLNGGELLAELKNANILVDGFPFLDDNNFLWLNIDNKDVEKATIVISAHNGTTVTPDNTKSKAALLEKLGITEDEARLLLS